MAKELCLCNIKAEFIGIWDTVKNNPLGLPNRLHGTADNIRSAFAERRNPQDNISSFSYFLGTDRQGNPDLVSPHFGSMTDSLRRYVDYSHRNPVAIEQLDHWGKIRDTALNLLDGEEFYSLVPREIKVEDGVALMKLKREGNNFSGETQLLPDMAETQAKLLLKTLKEKTQGRIENLGLEENPPSIFRIVVKPPEGKKSVDLKEDLPLLLRAVLGEKNQEQSPQHLSSLFAFQPQAFLAIPLLLWLNSPQYLPFFHENQVLPTAHISESEQLSSADVAPVVARAAQAAQADKMTSPEFRNNNRRVEPLVQPGFLQFQDVGLSVPLIGLASELDISEQNYSPKNPEVSSQSPHTAKQPTSVIVPTCLEFSPLKSDFSPKQTSLKVESGIVFSNLANRQHPELVSDSSPIPNQVRNDLMWGVSPVPLQRPRPAVERKLHMEENFSPRITSTLECHSRQFIDKKQDIGIRRRVSSPPSENLSRPKPRISVHRTFNYLESKIFRQPEKPDFLASPFKPQVRPQLEQVKSHPLSRHQPVLKDATLSSYQEISKNPFLNLSNRLIRKLFKTRPYLSEKFNVLKHQTQLELRNPLNLEHIPLRFSFAKKLPQFFLSEIPPLYFLELEPWIGQKRQDLPIIPLTANLFTTDFLITLFLLNFLWEFESFLHQKWQIVLPENGDILKIRLAESKEEILDMIEYDYYENEDIFDSVLPQFNFPHPLFLFPN